MLEVQSQSIHNSIDQPAQLIASIQTPNIELQLQTKTKTYGNYDNLLMNSLSEQVRLDRLTGIAQNALDAAFPNPSTPCDIDLRFSAIIGDRGQRQTTKGLTYSLWLLGGEKKQVTITSDDRTSDARFQHLKLYGIVDPSIPLCKGADCRPSSKLFAQREPDPSDSDYVDVRNTISTEVQCYCGNHWTVKNQDVKKPETTPTPLPTVAPTPVPRTRPEAPPNTGDGSCDEARRLGLPIVMGEPCPTSIIDPFQYTDFASQENPNFASWFLQNQRQDLK